jgi:hypothetical protein
MIYIYDMVWYDTIYSIVISSIFVQVMYVLYVMYVYVIYALYLA